MMAAQAVPGLDYQAENRQLRAEISILQEENTSLKNRLDKIEKWIKWAEESLGGTQKVASKIKERVEKLEETESPAVDRHIATLVAWLNDHSATRKGMTYQEAADELHVDIDYISQMKDAIHLDGRLVVEKKPSGNRRMQIRLV